MKLYYSDVLSPRKVCALARHLQLPMEYIYLDLARGEHLQPAYLAINPNGKVPTLVDGERTLWEANAIMCHLALRADSDMWPRDPAQQVEIVRWFSWDLQHFTRYGGTLYFEHIIKARFGLGNPDPVAVADAQKHFRRFAAILETHLRDRQWLLGDGISVADFALAITLPYAERAHIPLDEFEHVQGWHERLCELDAWRYPFPDPVPAT